MEIFGVGYPWNVPIFIGLMFLFNTVLFVICEWLERRRRSR